MTTRTRGIQLLPCIYSTSYSRFCNYDASTWAYLFSALINHFHGRQVPKFPTDSTAMAAACVASERLLSLGTKIIAVGRNYAAHAKELGNAVPKVSLFLLLLLLLAIPHFSTVITRNFLCESWGY